MVIFKIFIIGIIILIAALIINSLATKIGALTWYDFLKETQKVAWYQYLWLLIGYPFLLGLSAYFGKSLLDKIF